jgi:hypothetical protein
VAWSEISPMIPIEIAALRDATSTLRDTFTQPGWLEVPTIIRLSMLRGLRTLVGQSKSYFSHSKLSSLYRIQSSFCLILQGILKFISLHFICYKTSQILHTEMETHNPRIDASQAESHLPDIIERVKQRARDSEVFTANDDDMENIGKEL